MNIADIQTFVAIAELGGFTHAARRLHRSQPAISRRLGILEHEIGAPLFERLRRRARLTEAGRVFLPHAEAALASLRDGHDAVRGLPEARGRDFACSGRYARRYAHRRRPPPIREARQGCGPSAPTPDCLEPRGDRPGPAGRCDVGLALLWQRSAGTRLAGCGQRSHAGGSSARTPSGRPSGPPGASAGPASDGSSFPPTSGEQDPVRPWHANWFGLGSTAPTSL